MRKNGWIIWTKNDQRSRMFIVAEPEFIDAEQSVLDAANVESIWSYVSIDVTPFFGIIGGQILECISGNDLSVITPGGRRLVD